MDSADIGTLERVVGDVSHTGPVLKGLFAFISKHVDKKQMIVMLQAGEHQLHLAGMILDHKHVRKLLGPHHEHLTSNYAKLHDARRDLEENLQALRNQDIWQKFRVSRRVSAWVRRSVAYKHDVVRQSDWAKLGLVLRDGKLVSIKEALASPSEQTLVAPGSRDIDKAVKKEDDEDESDIGLCCLVTFVSDDDVSTGEAHEMQDLQSDDPGPSVPQKKVRFTKLFKGKGRADSEEP